MSTVNYQVRDNRYVQMPALNFQGTIPDGNTIIVGPTNTANFATLTQEVQSTGVLNVALRFSNDSSTWSAYQTKITPSGTTLSAFNTTVLGAFVTLRIINSSGSPVTTNLMSYGSMNQVIPSEQDTFRTIDDPIQTTDQLLLSKTVLSGSLQGTGISNIDLMSPGTLTVGQYNGSMRQVCCDPELCGTLPKNLGMINLGDYSGSSTVNITAENGVTLSATGLTIVETNHGLPFGSINDTFVLRFNAAFTSGETYIAFGDQYVGIGVTAAGVFSVTYMTGNVSQVYTQSLEFVSNTTCNPAFNLGGTTFTVTGVTKLTGPQVTIERLSNNVPMSAYFIKDRVFFRRVGPALNTSAASVTGNTSFYSGQPTMISGTFGTQNTILSSAFNIDKMDGTGYLPSINPATGVSGELVFTSDGNLLLMITDPRNGSLSPVHRAKVSSGIFTGDHSRLSIRSNIASATIYDASLYSHREPVALGMLQESYASRSFWPIKVVQYDGYIYLLNITKNVKTAKMTKLTVTLPSMYCTQIYLLKNSIMYPQYETLPYTSSNFTFAPATDGFWSPTDATYNSSQLNSDKYVNQVIASRYCGGCAEFDAIELDYFDCLTIAINPGNVVGVMNYSVLVEYTI